MLLRGQALVLQIASAGSNRGAVSTVQPLVGARVLIAEDEPYLAFDIMSVLLKAGAKVIGPAMSLERTLELVLAGNLSCGVLDVRLRDGLVFPAAHLLRERGAGIVFHTGQIDAEGLKRDWPDSEILSKPAPLRLLIPAILAACSSRGLENSLSSKQKLKTFG